MKSPLEVLRTNRIIHFSEIIAIASLGLTFIVPPEFRAATLTSMAFFGLIGIFEFVWQLTPPER
jgi:hypothetical protein